MACRAWLYSAWSSLAALQDGILDGTDCLGMVGEGRLLARIAGSLMANYMFRPKK